jgi:hypothetical protein
MLVAVALHTAQIMGCGSTSDAIAPARSKPTAMAAAVNPFGIMKRLESTIAIAITKDARNAPNNPSEPEYRDQTSTEGGKKHEPEQELPA